MEAGIFPKGESGTEPWAESEFQSGKESEVLTGNSIISCTALTEEKIGVIATVESHNTEILFIPRDAFLELLEEHSGLYLKLPVVMEKERRNKANQLKINPE